MCIRLHYSIILLLTSCSYQSIHTEEQYNYCKALRQEQIFGQTEIYLPAYCDFYK